MSSEPLWLMPISAIRYVGWPAPIVLRPIETESRLAVDSLTRTAGGHGVTVAVPVPVPDGVRYDTTVSE